jgi:hypothetical protein
VQSSLRVEHVAEREQIQLVGATTMVEHEQAIRLAVRRPLAEFELGHHTDVCACEDICGAR